jgi:hypothetical protein
LVLLCVGYLSNILTKKLATEYFLSSLLKGVNPLNKRYVLALNKIDK